MLVLGVFWAPGRSRAEETDDAHPRRAVAMAVMNETPAVWIADDRGWIPASGVEPVSLCVGGRCRPIVERRECAAPECPGPGTLLIASGPLGSVDDFPDDVEGFAEELESLRDDAVLGQLSPSFGQHPDYDPDRDEDDGGGLSFTFSLGGVVASESRGAALLGGMGTAGIVVRFDTDEAYADPDDAPPFATLVGDRFGLEARVRVFPEPGTQELTYSIGGALVMENRIAGSMFQVPGLVSLLLPELGTFVRGGRSSLYAGWGFPLKVFGTRALGVQVRAEVLVVADFEGDRAGSLMSLSIQGGLQ